MNAVASTVAQRVLGIDPGTRGGLALVGIGAGWPLIDCAAMPTKDRGVSVTNNVVDGRRLAELLEQWRPTIIVVEDVQPMPSRPEDGETEQDRRTMSPRHAFSFGWTCGGIATLCEGLRYDVRTVRPQTWKKAAGLRRVGDRKRSDVKAEALAMARRHWPQAAFERAKDEALAEAALIARFGLASQMRFF